MLKALTQNLTGFDEIHLCTPRILSSEEYEPIASFPIHFHLDKEVLDIPVNKFKYRPPWVYQQMIKLFQNVTKNNWYYVCDCDVTLTNKLDMFNETGHPIWHYGWPQDTQPYYNFNKAMFGFGNELGHTALCDMGFYGKSYVKKLLEYTEYSSVGHFINESFKVINKDCYPSEADIYMNYMALKHPDIYDVQHLELKAIGREHKNPEQHVWSAEDMKKEIDQAKSEGFKAVACHSWNDLQQYPW